MPSPRELHETMSSDIMNSLAQNTQKQYKTYWNSFIEFVNHIFRVKSKFITSLHVQYYITYLFHYKKLSISSIRGYLSSISFYSKMKFNKDISKSFAIHRLLKTYSNSNNTQMTRKPINKKLLKKLIHNISTLHFSTYYKSAYVVIYYMMYHAALRISELASSSIRDHIINYSSVKINYKKLQIKVSLKSYKHSKNSSTPTIVIQCDKPDFKHLKTYLSLRGDTNGPFICHPDHAPFTRKEIVSTLKNQLQFLNYDATLYNTHSFRIGKTTDMAQKGFSELEIKMLGRWNSPAYKRYIKPQYIYSS